MPSPLSRPTRWIPTPPIRHIPSGSTPNPASVHASAGSATVNSRMENIGARRLHTIMTTQLEETLFDLPDASIKKIVVNAEAVREKLKSIVEDEDLRKYIL